MGAGKHKAMLAPSDEAPAAKKARVEEPAPAAANAAGGAGAPLLSAGLKHDPKQTGLMGFFKRATTTAAK